MTYHEVGLRVGRHRAAIVFTLLACLVPFWYALYTRHIWEDFFITFRHSQNLCEGQGLVYNPGAKVHGFTSPLGTLLPALCYWATGSHSYEPALWLFRVMSVAAFCMGGLLILRRLSEETSFPPWMKYGFAILFAFEAKSVAFSVNGMETGFMLFFVGWGVFLVLRDSVTNWVQMALCWAGFMWTRPDAFVAIVALVAGSLVFFPEARKRTFVAIVKSGVLAAVLYLPWFSWAWMYYGSPIPQTVLAKALSLGERTFTQIVNMIYVLIPGRAAQVFAPIYFCDEWWKPVWISRVAHVLGIYCAIYWLFPIRDRLGRAASLSFFTYCLYFGYIRYVFPWYMPPATLFGLVVLTSSVSSFARRLARRDWQFRIFSLAGMACVGVPILIFFGLNARLMRIQEKNIEMGNRVQVGLWLKQHVKPNETVYLEPVGYIGYFSGASVLDYPGLVSPEVVKLVKEKHRTMGSLLSDIQPDWLVLRPSEINTMFAGNPIFKDHYAPVKKFDVHERCAKYASMPGSGYMMYDSVFFIYKKKTPEVTLESADLGAARTSTALQ